MTHSPGTGLTPPFSGPTMPQSEASALSLVTGAACGYTTWAWLENHLWVLPRARRLSWASWERHQGLVQLHTVVRGGPQDPEAPRGGR